MSGLCTSIQTYYEGSYKRDFPKEVPIKAAQSFIITAALNLVVAESSVKVTLLGGALAVTSTLIEAVTRPIIKAVFPQNQFIGVCIQVSVSKVIVLGLAIAIAPWIGVTYKISTAILPFIAFIALNEEFYKRNVGMVEIL